MSDSNSLSHSPLKLLAPQILARLVLLYFAGETADNPELRQCLSYFFPVFCYSNPQNQRRVANVRVVAHFGELRRPGLTDCVRV